MENAILATAPGVIEIALEHAVCEPSLALIRIALVLRMRTDEKVATPEEADIDPPLIPLAIAEPLQSEVVCAVNETEEDDVVTVLLFASYNVTTG